MSLPVMDRARKLDIHRLVLASQQYCGGWLSWAWSRDGEKTASINARVSDLSDGGGTLHLSFRGNGVPIAQSIQIISEPCRFGGMRWFALCPAKGWKSQKLFSFGQGFYSRRSFGRHTYASRLDGNQCDRDLRRRNRLLFGKLKSEYPDFIPKPKWMRWKTYNALAEQHWRNEEVLERHLSGMLSRLERPKI